MFGSRRRLHGRRGLKHSCTILCKLRLPSPPSRAAWIETSRRLLSFLTEQVAAFTGGVD